MRSVQTHQLFRAASASVVALVVALAFSALMSLAAEPAAKPADAAKKKPASSSLDDALLKDLDNELLEGVGDMKAQPKPKPAPPAGEGAKAPPPADEAGEDIGSPGENEDPLARISQEMRSAQESIRELTKRASAEKIQRRIVDDLASLIEEVEKRSAQQSSGSKEKKSQKTGKRQMVQQPKASQNRNNSNNPAKDSTDRLTNAEAAKPDPQTLREMAKDSWGHLPPHAREQMSQNWPERFLPQYELMIERYYKRLAEEQNSK